MALWRFGVVNDDPDAARYIAEETNEGRLRQGWGVETLDLHLEKEKWIENYHHIISRCFNDIPRKNEALIHWNILSRMLNMKENDVLFINNLGPKGFDRSYFTVATANGNYYFDGDLKGGRAISGEKDDETCRDFRHVIPVTDVKIFSYGHDTLLPNVFGPPLMPSVIEIKPNFKVYRYFYEFCRDVYKA